MRYRFNIVDLITINALVAFGLTVFIAPREIRETFLSVANPVLSLALIVLSIATFKAVTQRGTRRVFWIGFAACGLGYLIPAISLWHSFPTSDLLVRLLVFGWFGERMSSAAVLRSHASDWYESYLQFSHSCVSICLAMLGGTVARYIFIRRQQRKQD